MVNDVPCELSAQESPLRMTQGRSSFSVELIHDSIHVLLSSYAKDVVAAVALSKSEKLLSVLDSCKTNSDLAETWVCQRDK